MRDKSICFEDCMEYDTSSVTRATLSVEEICSAFSEKKQEEDDEEPPAPTPSSSKVVSSLDVVIRYTMSLNTDDARAEKLGRLERELYLPSLKTHRSIELL